MSNHELGTIAKQLGHDRLELDHFGEGTRKGVRWVLRCSCGWHSLNLVLVDAAVAAGKNHLRKVVAEHVSDQRRNGRRVVPGSIAAGL